MTPKIPIAFSNPHLYLDQQMDRSFEVLHIRGRRITGTTIVTASSFYDAGIKAKSSLKKAGVNRYRVREMTDYAKSTPWQKIQPAWRSWSGF